MLSRNPHETRVNAIKMGAAALSSNNLQQRIFDWPRAGGRRTGMLPRRPVFRGRRTRLTVVFEHPDRRSRQPGSENQRRVIELITQYQTTLKVRREERTFLKLLRHP